MHRAVLPLLVPTCLAALLAAPAARAADSYDNCTGFIDSVPTTITTQGVWCLRKDLATAITSGNAITINTNNVTIDCNHFKLGGLAAGDASLAIGIFASSRQNGTIRNCNVRGFLHGIQLTGFDGGGHLVEYNRLDNNLRTGIDVRGSRNLVQRNLVFDTGGSTTSNMTHAIRASGDVVGNQIDGVFAASANGSADAYGISLGGATSTARDNRIHNLTPAGSGQVFGIAGSVNATSAVGNHISASIYAGVSGAGISSIRHCHGNTVSSFATAYSCLHSFGNLPQ